MPLQSFLMDLCALLIVVLCAIFYARRGVVAGLISFAGTLGALLAAFAGSRWLAPVVFNKFFAPRLLEGMTEAVSKQGVTDVAQMVNDAMSFLPESVRQAVLQNLGPHIPNASAAEMASQVVDNVMAPLIVPFVQIVLFFLILFVVRTLVGIVRRMALGLTRLPVISALNGAVGAALGVLVSVLYIYILMCAIWGYDKINPANAIGNLYFSKSFLWEWMAPLNFIAKL